MRAGGREAAPAGPTHASAPTPNLFLALKVAAASGPCSSLHQDHVPSFTQLVLLCLSRVQALKSPPQKAGISMELLSRDTPSHFLYYLLHSSDKHLKLSSFLSHGSLSLISPRRAPSCFQVYYQFLEQCLAHSRH